MPYLKSLLFILSLWLVSPAYADQFEPFTENGKVGLKDTSINAVVIPAKFEAIGWSDKSFSIINGVTGALQNEKWALIDVADHKVTQHYFNTLIPSSQQNFISSKRDNNSILTNYGLIDSRGKTIIEFKYSSIAPNPKGLIVSQKKGNKYLRGLISERGQIIIPLEFQEIRFLNEEHVAVSNFNNQFALFSTTGKPLTDFQYEYIQTYNESYYLISEFNHQGLLSKSLNLIIPPKYKDLQFYDTEVKAFPFTQWDYFKNDTYIETYHFDDINFLDEGKFTTLADGKTGVISSSKEYLTFLPKETLVQTNESIFVTRTSSNRYKVYSRKGSPLFNDSFEEVHLYDELFFAKNSQANGHPWAVYNFQGKKLNLSNYQTFIQKSTSFFEGRRNNKLGLIGSNGKEASPFLYDELSDFKHERAIAYYNGSYGLINTNGLWIMTPYYDSLSINENRIYFKQGSEYGLADFYGKVLYRSQQPFQSYASAIIQTEEDSTKTIYSTQGERLLEYTYDSVKLIGEELLLLYRDNQSFVYRPSDGHDLKLDTDIEFIGEMKNGFSPVYKGGQWGFLDAKGRVSIANRYEEAGSFSEGLFAVKLIGKWGFVNEQEEIVIQPNYDFVSPFKNELSIVRNDNKWGIINKEGKTVISANYDNITSIKDYFLIQSNSQVGLADATGNIIKNPSFDSIWPLTYNYFLVERNGLYGVINSTGNDIIPTIYQTIKQSGNKFLCSKRAEVDTFKLK